MATIGIRSRATPCGSLLALLCCGVLVLVRHADSFTIQRQHQQRHQHHPGSSPVRTTPTTLTNPQPRRRNPRTAVAFGSPNADNNSNNNNSNNSSSDSPAKKRKRKRKAASATAASATAPAPAVRQPQQPQPQQADTAEAVVAPLRPREDKAVSVQVRDVRDLVSGGRVGSSSRSSSSRSDGPQPRSSSSSSPSSAAATATTFDASSSGADGDDGDDDDDNGEEADAYKRLLQDARELQALEEASKGRSSNDGTKVGSLAAEQGDGASPSPFSAPRAVQDALSAVVTADFFLICGLLLWFLAGIVSSSLFKNDAVQIAFNNIFEPVVQPALGVLMLGSALSAVFKEEDEGADL